MNPVTQSVFCGALLLSTACRDPDRDEAVGEHTAALTPVTWTDVVGASASGNDLTKTDPVTAFNAGAVSVESFTGDGYVEFTTGEATTDKACGLANGNGGQTLGDIEYAIRLNAAGRVSIVEGGTTVATLGHYAAGDIFRVQSLGEVVTYHRNGELLYTSELAPSFPLMADTALRTPGGTIQDVVIDSLLFWGDVEGAEAVGNDLTKTAPEDLFNAGAVSIATIPDGDGYVEFRVADATTAKAAGLSSGNSNQSRGDIDFALFLTATGGVQVYEAGTRIGTFGAYAAGDRFQVAVAGGVVTYYRNWVPLYTSLATPSLPLLLDTSLKTPGARILDGRVVVGSPVPECSPLEESLPETAQSIDAESDVFVLADNLATPPVARVYRQASDGWVFEQDLEKPDGPTERGWGKNGVVTDGQTIAVGGGYWVFESELPYLQIYRHDGVGWAPDGFIDSCPGPDLDGLAGFDVAGDVLAVAEETPTRLRIYRRRPATGKWRLEAVLPSPTGITFSWIAIGGDKVFASLRGADSEPLGAVYVYQYNPSLPDPPALDPCTSSDPGKWQLTATLRPPSDEHRFGWAPIDAGPSGKRLVISDYRHGHHDAFVFELIAGAWEQVALLQRTLNDQRQFAAHVAFGGPGGDSIVAVGGDAVWVFGDLDDDWRLISYSDHGAGIYVAATADTVFTVDLGSVIDDNDDVVAVQSLEPVCLPE